jgi:hypothetical protein
MTVYGQGFGYASGGYVPFLTQSLSKQARAAAVCVSVADDPCNVNKCRKRGSIEGL